MLKYVIFKLRFEISACTDFSFYIPLKDRLRGAMSWNVTGCHGMSREIHGQRGCYSGRHITVQFKYNYAVKKFQLQLKLQLTLKK